MTDKMADYMKAINSWRPKTPQDKAMMARMRRMGKAHKATKEQRAKLKQLSPLVFGG